MTDSIRLRLKPEDFADSDKVKSAIEKAVAEPVNDWKIVRKSIDARQRQIWVDADFLVATGDDTEVAVASHHVPFKPLAPDAPVVVIVGAGPAGLFAALRAIERGWKPVVVERGKPVEERLHDIVALQKEGKLNPDSNFCFGEGGAGAFSDGKLFTRSKKRGNVKEVLGLLHQHGAKDEVMYESHPHIGSDRLPRIIKAIRETITRNGGEIHFSTNFKRLIVEDGEVKGIATSDGREFYGPVVLATGHSAREVYESLDESGVRLEQKGFAMGVRLEHPQNEIDKMIYHSPKGRGQYLPPAEYKMTEQVDGRGVYSFCMCPGGVIVPSASAEGESVVNGMSASGRSGRWANSGMVVEIRPEDFPEFSNQGPLGMLRLQQAVERRFYDESRSINAPAQRMRDFVEGKSSKNLPSSSYVPGAHPADMASLLPEHVGSRLRKGLEKMGKKHKGFLTNEAMLIGLESRTSSPVRIPRDPVSMHHPDLPGLYPVGEGAGFAGGIVSSAIDGRRAVDAIIDNSLQK